MPSPVSCTRMTISSFSLAVVTVTVPPSGPMDPTFKHGTTLFSLKF